MLFYPKAALVGPRSSYPRVLCVTVQTANPASIPLHTVFRIFGKCSIAIYPDSDIPSRGTCVPRLFR